MAAARRAWRSRDQSLSGESSRDLILFRVQGLGFRVSGFGFWVLGFGVWVLGFGFWVWC